MLLKVAIEIIISIPWSNIFFSDRNSVHAFRDQGRSFPNSELVRKRAKKEVHVLIPTVTCRGGLVVVVVVVARREASEREGVRTSSGERKK